MLRNVLPVVCMIVVLLATFGGLSYFYPPVDSHAIHLAKKSDRLPLITK